MRVSEELRDPWAMVVGGIAGGLGWAVGIPALAAAGVGAGVWAAKALAGALIDRAGGSEPDSARPAVPQIRAGSPEAAFVTRAKRATESFARLASEAPAGAIAAQAGSIGGQARTTLEGVTRLASQASAVAAAMERVNPSTLAEQEEHLRARRDKATLDPLRHEIDRSLASVADQKQVRQRLEDARETVLARLEATVLGLESLVARLVEVLAMVEAAAPLEGVSRLDALAEELEGLRNGLAETEELSRNVLSQVADSSTVTTSAPRPGRRSRGRGDSGAKAP